jgi:large subunit ribosomal protein L1
VGGERISANHNSINRDELIITTSNGAEMKRSKKYMAAAAKVNADQLYQPLSAMKVVKETITVKFDPSVEVALVLGVDPKKADQAVRSTVNLPHGTGKTARVLVFATAERADEARAAGADIVGGDELIDEVSKGRLDYDAVVSTPELMGKVGRLGKVKGGKIEFRVDKNSNLHFIIGKASFSAEQLADNYAAAIDEVMRSKPSSSKGRYIRKSVVSTTMGPGVQLDPNFAREGAAPIQ